MNREIIFRGKRVDNGKWYWGYYVCQMRYPDTREDVRHALTAFSCFTDYLTPKPMPGIEIQADTVGQFTGLYDADGNRIFEGDIIQGKRGPAYVIEYGEGIAGYLARAAEESTWTPSMNAGTMKNYRIIGNRWDNPELMEGEHKESEIDWAKVSVNTPILVKDPASAEWHKRYFAKFKRYVYAWDNGCTSFTAEGMTCWKYARLWEGSEEQRMVKEGR